ncbi:MAG TPA: ribosome silencing factor [Bacteroidales bacterium]|nr:ribosome silencing factor [Bacteroidales bacterium]HQA86278.1 ribosome silencing factor [Bacteroidales bacterium]
MGKKKVNDSIKIIEQNNLQDVIIQSLIEKKGEDIVCINLQSIKHVFFDYFIICTANSKPHVETLTDFVKEMSYKQANTRPTYVEGIVNSEWVLLDYFNILVHIFQPEARAYYNLEQLWSDAEIQQF